MTTSLLRAALCWLVALSAARAAAQTVPVYGDITDAGTGKPVAARLYLRGDADGNWHFPRSVPPYGSAVRYEKRSGFNTNATEFHTTLSAHQWVAELPPGGYTAVVERGKEYLPLTNRFTVAAKPIEVKLPLKRWVNMAARGWFSGDAHNHRAPAELESAMLAEDVNVALPMIDWTTVDTMPPSLSDKNMKGNFGAQPVVVDPTHVWFPRNTEYEIFRSGGKQHTLGAFLIVGHKERFDIPVFPLKRVSERAHAEGGLIDLEKHNWPWSVAIVPVLKPDLFELANNHHWRVEFGVRNWAVPAPKWMRLAERGLGNGSGTDTELAWTHYGFETYYALLNCGFRLKPTAGTANGVHPVPLGFSRVYVHCEGGFSYEKWMKGLGEGRSFVTTGPLLMATLNETLPGTHLKFPGPTKVKFETTTPRQDGKLNYEWVINGDVQEDLKYGVSNSETGRYLTKKSGVAVSGMTVPGIGGAPDRKIWGDLEIQESGWVAVRCFVRLPDGRLRFAHTAPWWVEIEGKPLRPRREQADWFVQRTEEEIARNTGVLSTEQLAEFHEALAAWKKIQATAK
ncbi:MAG: CehA/McbA family metallohydrolase [Limisphaerales bacterium]